MDSFELNKIAGAVLFALLVTFGLSIFSEIIFETEAPETPGYIIAVAEEPAEGAEGGEAAASQPIGVLLASADPAAGEASIRKCATCHTFGESEANKIGPNLWGVVDRPIAAHEGYEYDEAMHAYAEQAQTWSFDNLNAFLHDPKGVVPGTKMAFAGLKNDGERANVIAYLRSLSADPAPLPEAEAAPAEGEEAAAPAEPAEGAAPAGEAPTEDEAATAEPEEGATPAVEQPEAPAEQTAQTETPEAPAEPAAPAAAAPAEPAEPAAAEPAAAEPAEAESAETGGGAATGFVALVAAGDPSRGQNLAKRCAACHTFEKDGANKVGPHLWGIVDRPVASVADFEYSEAMTAFAEGGAKTWTYDELSAYLENPKAHVPGNKMAFPGVKKEDDRANLIAYLRSLADSPAPLPGAQ